MPIAGNNSKCVTRRELQDLWQAVEELFESAQRLIALAKKKRPAAGEIREAAKTFLCSWPDYLDNRPDVGSFWMGVSPSGCLGQAGEFAVAVAGAMAREPALVMPPRHRGQEKYIEHTLKDVETRWAKISRSLAQIQVPNEQAIKSGMEAEFNRAVVVLNAPLQATAPGVAATPVIYSHGDKQYSTDGKNPIRVSENEENVLQVFSKYQAVKEPDLVKMANLENAAKVFRDLGKKYNGVFKDALIPPGGKGKGGYRATVKPAP
jgi:hypothetical protein